MERLTTREEHPHGAEGRSRENLTGRYCRGCFEATACVEKLAEYEDAEEDGRLIALQCKPKDEVYCFFLFADGVIQKANVVKIELKKNQFGDKCYFVEPVGRRGCLFKYYDGDFGKTIFLTREAAEQEMLRRNGKPTRNQ